MAKLVRTPREPIIEHVSSFVIRCSFCDNHVRKDVAKNSIRGNGSDNTDEHNIRVAVSEIAKRDGWNFVLSTHDAVINVCPEHVYGAMNMGLLPDTRPKSTDDPVEDRDYDKPRMIKDIPQA